MIQIPIIPIYSLIKIVYLSLYDVTIVIQLIQPICPLQIKQRIYCSLLWTYQNAKRKLYSTYNADYESTSEEIEKFNYSDKTVWTTLESGGQSPIPKIEAITDMEAGVKAVEYFIHTGELYPGIDWACQL